MRDSAYLSSLLPFVLIPLLLSGCGGKGAVETGGGGGTYGGSGYYPGSGGSGGAPVTSGGTTSGGTTSGGTTSGGTSGGSGGSGGSGATVVSALTDALIEPVIAPGPLPAAAQGVVSGGQFRTIAGAHVYVLQAAAAPDAAAQSLLTAGPTGRLGHYALTDAYGSFTIAGLYTCTPGQFVYLLARRGDSGHNGPNAATALLTALGPCPATGNFTAAQPFVVVNPVSTLAAAYALAPTATDPTHVAVTAATFSRAASLADPATASANAIILRDPNTAARQAKLNTLANILAACINTSGPDTPACASLFANTGQATDTASAALRIAQSPTVNVASLFALQPIAAAPFQPSLTTPPADLTLPPMHLPQLAANSTLPFSLDQ